jgi:hypothetical protein
VVAFLLRDPGPKILPETVASVRAEQGVQNEHLPVGKSESRTEGPVNTVTLSVNALVGSRIYFSRELLDGMLP